MGFTTGLPPPLLDVDPPLPPELPLLIPASPLVAADVEQWLTPVTIATLMPETNVSAPKVCASFMSPAPSLKIPASRPLQNDDNIGKRNHTAESRRRLLHRGELHVGKGAPSCPEEKPLNDFVGSGAS
jgi:hypothetical protein